ncbi:MAG: hypothetical protein JO271_09455 [Verrucomicrobia bacterium]|nr:hypothetical protein [Verrucomicrobiota bacterium]
MVIRRFLALFFLLVFCLASAQANQILEGFTVLKGNGYAFELKAPLGWVLDDNVGNDQGLNVVFYPEESSWDKSDAVCYARVRSLDNRVSNIDQQVKDTVKAFRANGNPHVEAKFVKTITTEDASKAQVYFFTGDQFGNNEATAYVLAKGSIHFITLSARNKKAFRDALPAFDALVASYEDLTREPKFNPFHPFPHNY